MTNTRQIARTFVFVIGSLCCQRFLAGEVDETKIPPPLRLNRTAEPLVSDDINKNAAPSLEDWIERLGAPSFQTRQQAFLNLWRLVEVEPSFREKLDQFVEANDLETSVSIRWLRLLSKVTKANGHTQNQPGDIHAFFRDAMLLRSGDLEVLFKHAKPAAGIILKAYLSC